MVANRCIMRDGIDVFRHSNHMDAYMVAYLSLLFVGSGVVLFSIAVGMLSARRGWCIPMDVLDISGGVEQPGSSSRS